MRTIRKGAVVLALFLAIILGLPSSQEAPALARTQDRPNVLFIMLDDLDERLYDRVMDQTQRYVEDRGIRFDNATYGMSVCCPSRVNILTGKLPHNSRVYWNSPPQGGFETFRARGLHNNTYATTVNRAGYSTAYFGKFLNGYSHINGDIQGPNRFVSPGFDRWMVPTPEMPNLERARPGTWNVDGKIVEIKDPYHDRVVFERAMGYLDHRTQGKADRIPFFASVNFYAPHGPADHPDSYDSMFRNVTVSRSPSFDEEDVSDKPSHVRSLSRISDAERSSLSQRYRDRMRSIEYVDRRVRDMVQLLASRGELSSTYIVFYSDNGYHMGQHRLGNQEHGTKGTPYIEDVRFPIVMRGPGIGAGQSSEAMAQNTDLRPTFEDMANATTPPGVDGTSLLPHAAGGVPFPRRYAISELVSDNGPRPEWKALYDSDEAYVLYPNTGEEEYYDLRADPYQLRSNPLDPRAALMRVDLQRMARCDAAECY